MTTDKKLGLERFQVSVATKQTLPDMSSVKSRNYFARKSCIAKARNCDFNQSLYHPSLRKKTGVFLDCQDIQLCELNIDFIAIKHRF